MPDAQAFREDDEDSALAEALARMEAVREEAIGDPMEIENHRKRAYQGEELRERKQSKTEQEALWDGLEELNDVIRRDYVG